MGAAGTKRGTSGVSYKQDQLTFDEVFEETIDTKTIERQERDKRQAFCDQCFIDGLLNVIAFYMCVVCEKYLCEPCSQRHNERNESHMVVRVKRESGDYDGFDERERLEQIEREIDEYLSYLKNESDAERKAKFMKNYVCVCNYVYTKHELDKYSCNISGLNGYKNKWWVVCDYSNDCIKLFRLGSNVLQRYIRLGSRPFDVTEIIVENKTTEQDSASSSETAISGTYNKPNRKYLLAVTFPYKHLILILDLDKNPAVIHSKIKTKKACYGIDFYNGNIFIVCEERSPDFPWSVDILTVEGVTLKTVQIDVPYSWYPYLTVLNGNIYMADDDNSRVVCYNDEGRVLQEIKIDGSRPRGICVDRSEDKVYVSSRRHDKVYELKSDLSQYKSVLDQTTGYMKDPFAMCFYSDKLYVGHDSWSESRSHVTVVRLL